MIWNAETAREVTKDFKRYKEIKKEVAELIRKTCHEGNDFTQMTLNEPEWVGQELVKELIEKGYVAKHIRNKTADYSNIFVTWNEGSTFSIRW